MVLRPNREMDDAIQASTASTRVFAIPELVEHILTHIVPQQRCSSDRFSFPDQIAQATSIRTLYKLQRVNKTFSKTVQRSKTLRRAMFLEHAYSGEHQDKSMLQINPLIFTLSPATASISWRIAETPWLMCQHTIQFQVQVRDLNSLYDTPLVQGVLVQPSPQRRVSSWRRILLSNMPVQIQFNFNISERGAYWRNDYIWLDEGATFADLALLFAEDIRRQRKETK